MPRPDTQRSKLAGGPSGSDAAWVLDRSRRKRRLAACVLGAALLLNCQSAKSKGAPVGSSGAASQPHVAKGGTGQEPSHGGAAGGEVAKSASPSALSAEARAKLTTIRVSAHEGYVIVRREAEGWVISGPGGCTVRSERIDHALDNLSVLKSVPTTEAVPHGTAFQLQISVLVGEQLAVHLELADRNETGQLARLDDDSMVRVQGLDLSLWSPHPADWCK
jgi:hypothetical protein